ncbi:glycosyltransferase family 4 protein [Oryzihumus sp.]|uniref:glycosyltransferase family 4 protein n=1 Tax=Oryzihumus sp. TaxID=1968903 RepID=UPI002ED9B9A1
MIGQKGLPATFGGIEHHVEEVGRRLAERGHLVTVFCRSSYGAATGAAYLGMELRSAPTVGTKHLDAIVHSASSTALGLLAGADIVHYHGIGPGLLTPVPHYLSRAKVVLTIHGLDHQRGKWGHAAQAVLGAGHWMSGHLPDRTVVVSRALESHYREHFSHGCDYIPNGVVEPPDLPARRIVDELGLTPGGYALFVGRLVPEKAPDQLLRAYRRVPGNLPLVIVGDSSFTDDYADQVRDLATRDPRVMLPGFAYGDLLAELYRHAAVFVQPSLLEGLPLTLLEAASHGTPVVASDIAPHLEVLGLPAAGRRIFAAGDEDGLTRQISSALEGGEAERSGAAALRHQVLDTYRWDTAVDQLEQLYLQEVRVAPPTHRPRRPASAPGANVRGTLW